MKGWYCSTNDKRLRYDDNRLIRRGITHKMKWPYSYSTPVSYADGLSRDDFREFIRPTLCYAGLHASKNIHTACLFGAGRWIWRVEVTGRIDDDEYKFCGDERKYLWGIEIPLSIINAVLANYYNNGEEILLKYVRQEALKKGYIKKGERLR